MGEFNLKWAPTLIILFLSACDSADKLESKPLNNQNHLQLEINAPLASTISSSPIPFAKDCLHAVKICSYSFELPSGSPHLPTILLNGANHPLEMTGVSSITLEENENDAGKLQRFSLTLRGVPDHASDQTAKRFAYQILGTIQKSGWKHYFFPKDPRIAGNQSSKIPESDKVLGTPVQSHPWFDPAVEMSDAQWNTVDSFYTWYFYYDDQYLIFKSWRSPSGAEGKHRANYLFSIEVQSEQEFWMDHFEPSDRAHWKELLPSLLDKYLARRVALEQRAESASLSIDKSYRDPSIKALLPK